MRCVYCDTDYAFQGGEQRTIDSIVEEVKELGAPNICVTGGEPLAQKNCWPLLEKLCNEGFSVSLETGGAVSTDGVDSRVSVVLDIKTPASGELDKNTWSNIDNLQANDQVKFVICNREDYDWARFKLDELNLAARVSDVLFSPIHGSLKPVELADWIVADKLNVRLQLQLHKYLWGDEPGH